MRKTSLPFPAEEQEEIIHDCSLGVGDRVRLYIQADEPLRVVVFRVRERKVSSVIKEDFFHD